MLWIFPEYFPEECCPISPISKAATPTLSTGKPATLTQQVASRSQGQIKTTSFPSSKAATPTLSTGKPATLTQQVASRSQGQQTPHLSPLARQPLQLSPLASQPPSPSKLPYDHKVNKHHIFPHWQDSHSNSLHWQASHPHPASCLMITMSNTTSFPSGKAATPTLSTGKPATLTQQVALRSQGQTNTTSFPTGKAATPTLSTGNVALSTGRPTTPTDRCTCKTRCATKICPCKQKGSLCGSTCHPGRVSVNSCGKQEMIYRFVDLTATEIVKDVEEQHWVTADYLKLTKQDEADLCSRSHAWLNDRHISAALMLLKKQHPHISGLQTRTLQYTCTFDVHEEKEFANQNHSM